MICLILQLVHMLKTLITTSWITQDPPWLSADKTTTGGTGHFQQGWVDIFISIPSPANSDKGSTFPLLSQ